MTAAGCGTMKAFAKMVFCYEQIAQIFANLKTAIKSDRESLETNIEELKRANAALIEQQNTIERKD